MENGYKFDNPVEYEILELTAEGGMGTVFKALQYGAGNFAKTVALKVIREEFSAIKPFRDNFIGEGKLVADLIHTNIVQIYNLGKTETHQYFMVMEFVNGINLDEFLELHEAKGERVPVEIAVFIVSRICRGLSYAHKKRDSRGRLLGIVHRDVNPKNIMISLEGDVKLTDFGIAKALNIMYNKEGKVIAGKDEYLSPEQARREITDARADLFSCGIVLSELLLGKNIFLEEDPDETLQNILEKPIPDFKQEREDIDENLNNILQKSLTRDREQRYQDADEMLNALEVYLYSDGYGPTNEKLADYLKDYVDNEMYKASGLSSLKASRGVFREDTNF